MIGTAVNSTASSVYFTGFQGNLSEVFYPTVDHVATANLEFLVGDSSNTWVDEEKLMKWTVTRPDPHSMRWQATTTSEPAHNWQVTKMIFADPSQNTVIQQTTFTATGGKTVGDFNLYLLFKPYLNNAAAKNSATKTPSGGNTYLVASSSDSTVNSALGTSLGWTVKGGTTMISCGYFGVNDGWQDLLGGSNPDHTMDWAYDCACKGNVVQTGWLNTAGNTAASVTFTVVLGFGSSQADAIATAAATLRENIATQQAIYDTAWHNYVAGLSDQGGTVDNQYYLSAMTLKSAQDKSSGAIVAGMGFPWGPNNGDNDLGYHLVWPRDMYKFANALFTAGDTASATSAVNWLFNTDMDQMSGRFPQNAFVNGMPSWNATQMDEQAMPIILAYRLGPSAYNPLWPKIRLTANYILNNGPWTQQERWEETGGYSPSTIAAEIAGLVSAAQIALENNDASDAASWLNAADYWQQNVQAWTYTTQGCPNTGSYCGVTSTYFRINTSDPSCGTFPGGWNPATGPNTTQTITIGNGGGTHREIDIVDGGFLELVRMGVKRANDPAISNSVATADRIIEENVGGNPGWWRYNYDGYGENNSGGAYDGKTGRGRLWPIFTAERGEYAIALAGTGSAGSSYLNALRALSSPQGFIPEQVWNTSLTLPPDEDTPGGWATTTPPQDPAGEPTGSIMPLNWAQGEYINLLASVAAGRVVDIPPQVCSRYNNCIVAPGPGQVQVNANASASTQWGQNMYVTGNTPTLGNWNTNLGLPLDPGSYPVWKNSLNLAASSSFQYKYYRKNSDGAVTWECYPGGGDCGQSRSLSTPASGTVNLNDTVNWN